MTQARLIPTPAYRALLDLLMVTDPWPLDAASHADILDFADAEAERRGLENWVAAYHSIKREKKEGKA